VRNQYSPFTAAVFLVACCVCLEAQTRDRTESQRQPSSSLSAEELFRRLSPSVFVVEVLDKDGSVVALGSGVAVGPTTLGFPEELPAARSAIFVVTNTHVIDPGVSVRVRQGDKTWSASVETISPGVTEDPDLSVLRVEGLNAPPVELRRYETL